MLTITLIILFRSCGTSDKYNPLLDTDIAEVFPQPPTRLVLPSKVTGCNLNSKPQLCVSVCVIHHLCYAY